LLLILTSVVQVLVFISPRNRVAQLEEIYVAYTGCGKLTLYFQMPQTNNVYEQTNS
jgi:hypothetical protein